MELRLQIKMNPALFLRDPESSRLGKSIVSEAISLIHELGFEDFTFRKLAVRIGTTEASVYRYFENKHRLLTYIITWFWTWMEYQVDLHTRHLEEAGLKIGAVIRLLAFRSVEAASPADAEVNMLHSVAIAEGNKAFLTHHVAEDNAAQMFRPYKDLCSRIAGIFASYCPGYPYPHSLASTVVETAHHQYYFRDHLPRLTDFGGQKSPEVLVEFLHHITFSALDTWKAGRNS